MKKYAKTLRLSELALNNAETLAAKDDRSFNYTVNKILEGLKVQKPKPKQLAPNLDNVVPVPQGVEIALWEDYLVMRKQQKAPNTERALKQLIKKLDDFRAKGQNPNEIVKQSYENGWKGLFELKNQPKQQPASTMGMFPQ